MLDSCRADKVGANGFPGPTTPRLDALAADQDALLFRWHFAQAPHTKASTASLFTGTYPFQHGVIVEDLLSEIELRSGRYREMRLASEYETLAESLHAAGYRTMASVWIRHLTEAAGFGQGFDRFVASDRKLSDRRAQEAALDFLAESPSPAFAYVHLRACHNPFLPAMRDEEYAARQAGRFDEVALRDAGIDPASAEFKPGVRSGAVRPNAEQIAYLHAVYESVVRGVDERLVGALVAGLRQRGLYDRTLLVVSADHGEELVDHGSYAHGHSVWNEVAHVPLVVKLPRGGRSPSLAQRVERATQTIDLMPSLLRYVGVDPPAICNLADLFRTGERSGPVFTQAPGSWAIVDLPWKAIVHEPGSAALFDLAADPGEQRDLASLRPDQLRRMVRLGEALQATLPRVGQSLGPEGGVSEAKIEELRSLGYIQ